jgi:hypothetical protein
MGRLDRTLIAVFILVAACTAPAAAAGSAFEAQQVQPEPTDAATIVESFLLARNMADFSGAASWCAPLLELQDQDGQWYVDTLETTFWLRQLSEKYLVETLNPLRVEGHMISWTERLTQRYVPFPEASGARLTIDVHAVIRDRKIVYLSGPYPPVPFRSPMAGPNEPGIEAARNAVNIPPANLFVGSALGLTLTTLLVSSGWKHALRRRGTSSAWVARGRRRGCWQ